MGSKGSSDYDNPMGYLDASRSSSIYGASDTITPKSYKTMFYMKY